MPDLPNITAQRVKFFHALKLKKYRQKYGQFVAEGTKSVIELINSSMLVKEITATEAWLEEYKNHLGGIRSSVATTPQLEKMTGFKTAPPVLALVDIPETGEIPESGWIIALDGIRDPGNLGTIIRTADWYGIGHVVCSPDCVDHLNPKVIASTMGSFTRVQVHYADLQEWLGRTALKTYACMMSGESVYRVKAKEGIILIGSESHGVSGSLLNHHTVPVTIPAVGQAESLNAAVAAAIVCDRLIGQP